jgi:alpha-L-fucosidase
MKPAATSNAPTAAPDFSWWRAARFGFFIHWGPCSLSGQEMSWSRPAQGADNYDALASRFDAPAFDPEAWVSLALESGARYLVLVCKHHDGFILWATDTDPHNVMNTPLGRDVVAEVSAACARAGLAFCVYFSPGDWRDPDCRHPENNPRFVERMHAQLTELLTRQGRVPLLWFDFDGRTNPSVPAETAALARHLQPGILLTNRLDALHPDESHARLGPSGDYVTPEQFVGGYCDHLPWETCMTIGTSWSWRPDDPVKTLRDCLVALLSAAGGDGNFLLDVGPHPDGHVEPDQAARLREIGAWLRAHGEAVYGTRGGPWYPTHDYASTRTAGAVYVHAFRPDLPALVLPVIPAAILSASLLDGTAIPFTQDATSLTLTFKPHAPASISPVLVVKLLLAAPPLSLAPIPPASTSGSLAYRRPARVSSSIAPDFLHTAQAALDDAPSTFWSPGRDEALAATFPGSDFTPIRKDPSHPVWHREGWLEVDLGSLFVVARARLAEKPSTPDNHLPVSSWKIEYHDNSAWLPAASGAAIGPTLEVVFSRRVTARLFRLSLAAPGRFALTAFQLFPTSA